MTGSLPPDVQQVFARYLTTELTTIDGRGRPITWPVTPYYEPGGAAISVTTGLGYPRKANDAERNGRVSLLFSDATGSGLMDPPLVLVQGSATVDREDLSANAERYARESRAKLGSGPPSGRALRGLFDWYYARIYIHVRPERVFVWPRGDTGAEPTLYDTHMEEVRSGHDEEPDVDRVPAASEPGVWDGRLDALGDEYETAVLSVVAPDGFPFSVRARVSPDRRAGLVRIAGDPVGVPLDAGCACLTAHDHDERFTWQRNFQARGKLIRDAEGWALIPQRVVGGFELPPTTALGRLRLNFGKIRRFRRTAKRERAAADL